MNTYKPVIGLEIHVELKTKSKMFCQCEADYFGKEPNTNTCPVCLGLPGALPVPNKKAIEWCILIGKALNCTIPSISKFDRKHYFYPDLPKGYQISQYDDPLAVNGFLELSHPKGVQARKFRITRVHQEEDTGKLIHSGSDTLVDFNRSGVPLVEIVTEPDFDNTEDVKEFLEELDTIIRYLDVSDADMEKGSMRMEPNISLIVILAKAGIQKKNWIPDPLQGKQVGDDRIRKLPDYKVEVKNINSFRFVKQAIEYEIERQKEILEKGKTPLQETRGFDEKKVVTYSQRSKEKAQDYRYFPEPDIPPLEFTKEYVDSIKAPELPVQKLMRYVRDFGVREQDAFVLTRDKNVAVYFEAVMSKLKTQKSKLQLKSQNLEQLIVNMIINKKLSTELSTNEFIKKVINLLQPEETDEKLLNVVINQLIETHKKVVEDYKGGKENALMFLVGQVMKEMKGKADAKLVILKLKAKISKL